MKTKAKVQGRWHDNRHTFITGLAESGEAGDETIRDIAGHVSKQMLKHYSHIGMDAKRRAVQFFVPKNPTLVKTGDVVFEPEIEQIPESSAKDSTEVVRIN